MKHLGSFVYRSEPKHVSQRPDKRSPVSFEKLEEDKDLVFFRRVARYLRERERRA